MRTMLVPDLSSLTEATANSGTFVSAGSALAGAVPIVVTLRERAGRREVRFVPVQQTEGEGHSKGEQSRGPDEQFPARAEPEDASSGQDAFDAASEVSAGNSRCAQRRRFDAESAGHQQALGVNLRPGGAADHRLIAGAFALIQHAGLHPPDGGMEPENGFHDHMEGRRQIVVATPHGEVRAPGWLRYVRPPGGRKDVAARSAGRKMPKMPGSVVSCECSRATREVLPAADSSRRRMFNSRPCWMGIARRRAEATCLQRRYHSSATVAAPQSHTTTRIAGNHGVAGSTSLTAWVRTTGE